MILFDERSVRTRAALIMTGVFAFGAPFAIAQSSDKETSESETATDPSGDPAKSVDSKVDDARVNSGLLAAQRLEREGRWREAADKYAEVLKLMPDNAKARDGFQKAMQMVDNGSMLNSGSGAGMAGIELQMQEQQQRTVIEFKDALSRSEELLDKEDFVAADRAILTAQIKLRQRRQYLSELEFNDFNGQAEALIQRIGEARINAQLLKEQTERDEAARSREASEQREQSERTKIITESLLRVRKLQEELKYREALQVIDEILFIDPQNPAALALRDVMETTMIYRNFASDDREKSMAYAKEWVEVNRSMIPPTINLSGPGDRSVAGFISYPEDWPQITYRRGANGGYRATPADRKVMKLMEEKVELNFVELPFVDVLDYFTKSIKGLQIYPDWKTLEDELNVMRDTPVTIRLTELPLDVGLTRLLEQVGDVGLHPAWEVQDGMLLISSLDQLEKRKNVVVYDIRDLVLPIPDYNDPPELQLGGGAGGGGFGGGGGGGGGGGLGGGGAGGGGFGGGGGGGGGGGDHPRSFDWEELTEEAVNELILIIQNSVPSNETTPIDKWAEFGGDSSILQFHRNLVIRTTSKNHMQIGRLLSMLREARSVMINVETRFLQMGTSWFEEIGVDLDLYFNTTGGGGVVDQARALDPNNQLKDFFDNGGNGRLKDSLIYGSVNQDPTADGSIINTVNTGRSFGAPADEGAPNYDYSAAFMPNIPGQPGNVVRNTEGWSPIGVVQNSLNLVESIASATNPTGLMGTVLGAAPALGLNVQYLDDIQVDLLVKATQADERAVELSAPRLTFLNGQGAWCSFIEQQSYVSGLTPITGDGAGAFEPNVSPLNTGIVLWLKGAASADRRFVTLNVHFQKSKQISITTQAFGGAAGGGGFGGGAGGFGGAIELPSIRLDEIMVTTSVPDKGTALLGGQRYKSEFETEAGVPILSKIPYINRFFTNRITATEEKTLIILLRPEIILQDEDEDILYPGLSEEVDLGAAYNP
ncbi:MAG: hypothetical protein CMJ29_04750 [Phycisphaerae bacterium]|nr:hypothetical protein [Phycisphaerae bacterium]